MNKYFSKDTKIFDLIEKYPLALDFLVNKGFSPLKNKAMLNAMGKITSLERACSLKKLNYEQVEEALISLIEGQNFSADVTLIQSNEDIKGDFVMKGVLPCPIRVPLLEAVHDFSSKTELDFAFDLKAASMGVDWLEEGIFSDNVDSMPDAMLSVGFKLFFDQKVMDKLFTNKLYSVPQQEINADFKNDYIDLTDYKSRFFILSVVPCVFLINDAVLAGRKCDSWEDLMSEELENSISIPMGDLDMFNAICVNIYAKYGREGIEKLARANKSSLHPSQMVRSNVMKAAPAVNIIPYFFANMAEEKKGMRVVWPKDGAIISPIFLVVKSEKADKAQEVLDFLHSDKISELLSANGKFPVTRLGVDNHLDEEKKFLWPGWDYINSQNIPALIKECEDIFGVVQ